jgi:hypothetical protein
MQHTVARIMPFIILAIMTAGVVVAAAGLPGREARAGHSRPAATLPIAWIPPPAVVQISPCVPHMGEHWANPTDLPTGPIYTVHNGRLISIEYMLTQADFAAGKSWSDLTFRYWGQELPIDHADIDFLPMGHDGFAVPHYDLHFYVVPHAEDRAITCEP